MSIDRQPDRALSASAHEGDLDALTELWYRHGAYGLAVAHGQAPEDDWEAISARAWTLILDASPHDLAGGFRPYLYLLIRAITSAEESSPRPDAMLTTAYHGLPDQLREVLWYAHIDQMRPFQMAALIGTGAPDIPGLLHRGREGLRQEWVRLHIAATTQYSLCRKVWEQADAYVHDELSERDRGAIDRHRRICRGCRPVDSDAITVASHLRTVVLPSIAGAGGAANLLAYLQTHGPCVRAPTGLPSLVEHLIAPGPVPEAVTRSEPPARTRPVRAGRGEPGGAGHGEPGRAGRGEPATRRGRTEPAAPVGATGRAGFTAQTGFNARIGSTERNATARTGATARTDATAPAGATPRTGSAARTGATPRTGAAAPADATPRTDATARIESAGRTIRSAGEVAHDRIEAARSRLRASVQRHREPVSEPVARTSPPVRATGAETAMAREPAPPPTFTEWFDAPKRRRVSRPALACTGLLTAVAISVIAIGVHQVARPGDPASPQSGSVSVAPPAFPPVIELIDTGANNNLFPIVSGTAPANATIKVRIGDDSTTVVADADGGWTTADTGLEPSELRGAVLATVGDLDPASAAFELIAPPVPTLDQDDSLTLIGLGNATVQVIVDGAIAATVPLGEAGTYSGLLDLPSGPHFLQSRYIDGDRSGPSSPAIIFTAT